MLQKLSIVLAQVKAGNTSENVLNEMHQIIYYLYRAKKILKKAYNNIINSIQLWNRMDTIFMNSENSKTSDAHRLLLNLWDKIELKKSDKYVALSILAYTIHGKTWKSCTKTINLKYVEWKTWITRWIIFCIRYSRLVWLYHEKWYIYW